MNPILPIVLQNLIDPAFVLHGRIHLLKAEPRLWIKREDELSSGISGSKYRKFASLLPYWKQNQVDEVVLIGSAQSNNVTGALQILNENSIKAHLVLLESNEQELKGNLLWMHLLYDMKETTWVKRKDWPNVAELARCYQSEQAAIGKKVFVLPEGGLAIEAMPGAIGLAYDIMQNEHKSGLAFDHIFVDSGSGATAIGLLLGLRMLERKSTVHITLVAGTEAELMAKYQNMAAQAEYSLGIKLPSANPVQTRFYRPVAAPSFGSVTSAIMAETLNIARSEGILMDPVYSVKHLMTAKQVIADLGLSGNLLFMYNGGSLGLSGFGDKLRGVVGKPYKQ